ncbi:class I SAM-dependent methyltransferase [Sideroxydans lithotrophicus]|uniref:O-methyltransferase family 3 n=1 Tax=Sideroxydans lithotrophicus (strain ES-1) TaxID=580332 RepID=D5CPW4_SIDLE|nr:class I SAM-dependent methyltransferase [Sideroxydans lithotrophicus]ADE11128.1 O-methyltransferase family 3 [Sideroxydans lithotrophicus ES-1]
MQKAEIQFSEGVHEYLLASLREPEILKRLREETSRDPHAIMQIPPEQGQFMSFLVKALGVRKALEIGTYTGYSALTVAMALPDDGKLVACDINEEWVGIGRRYWKEAGVEHKIDFRFGKAVRTLDALIKSGEANSFDFIFIDADKASYDEYYERSLSLLRPGGVIAIDNVLLFGRVVEGSLPDAEPGSRMNAADIDAMRKLNLKIRNDPRVDETMLPIADGLTLVRKL